MPPRSLPCPSCGKLYFSSSLPIHQRTCQDKQTRTCHECPYCRGYFPVTEFAFHTSRCGARPLRDDTRVPLPSLSYAFQSTPRVTPRASPPLPPEAVLSRRPCIVCGRLFAFDRLAIHENACRAVNRPRRVFDSRSKRSASCGLDVSGAWGSNSPGDGTFGPPPPVPTRRVGGRSTGRSTGRPSVSAGAGGGGLGEVGGMGEVLVGVLQQDFHAHYPFSPRSRPSSATPRARTFSTPPASSASATAGTQRQQQRRQSHWREQHEGFLQLLKGAREKAASHAFPPPQRLLAQPPLTPVRQHYEGVPSRRPSSALQHTSLSGGGGVAAAAAGVGLPRRGSVVPHPPPSRPLAGYHAKLAQISRDQDALIAKLEARSSLQPSSPPPPPTLTRGRLSAPAHTFQAPIRTVVGRI
jgi:hypothetical protein